MGSDNIDIGIIIALQEEFNELYNEIETYCQAIPDPKTGSYYYRFRHPSTTRRYECVATFAGQMGPTKAGLVTQRLISQWNPRALVMIGIAGSLDSDIKIGDVVVATQIDAYLEHAKGGPGKSGSGFVFQFGGEVYRPSVDLVNFALHMKFSHKLVFEHWRKACLKDLLTLYDKDLLEDFLANGLLHREVELVPGHLASGPAVGAAKAFTHWLKGRDRKYLAMEMESAGLIAAAYEEADPRHTLILRAISDYADERKAEMDKIKGGRFRGYAMRNAIRLLWSFLEANALPQLSSKSLAPNNALIALDLQAVTKEKSRQGISGEVLRQLREALMQCEEFSNIDQLRAIFLDPRIAPWKNGIPQANNIAAQVDQVIGYLYGKYNTSSDHALAVLVRLLGDRRSQSNDLHDCLIQLADELAGY